MDDNSASRQRLVVKTEKSGLSCVVTVLPGRAVETPSDFEIISMLEEQSIASSLIDRDALSDLLALARGEPDGEHRGVLATGTPQVDGEHASFRLAPELAERVEEAQRRADRIASGEERPPTSEVMDGTADADAVDFREQSAFVIVRAGQPLGEVTEPTPGTDGTDVYGAVIAAKKGRSLTLETDDSTRIENGQIIAAVDGRLISRIGMLLIERTLTVTGDVDFTTGNIDFPGSVVLNEGVKDNFVVRARDDLRVEHLVEAAILEVGRDLTLARGMAGRETGTVCVGRDLHAGYLDGVTGTVSRDCIVANEIKECDLQVDGRVESPGCAFYGGSIDARKRVEFAIVGSSGGIETAVSVGTLPELDSLVTRLGRMLETLGSESARSTDELAALNNMIRKLTPTQAERLTELQFSQIQANSLTQKIALAAGQLLDAISSPAPPVLSVRRTLHRGVQVRLRHVEMLIKDTIQCPVVLDLDRSGTPRCFLNGASEPTPIGKVASITAGTTEDPIALLTEYSNRVAAAATPPPSSNAA